MRLKSGFFERLGNSSAIFKLGDSCKHALDLWVWSLWHEVIFKITFLVHLKQKNQNGLA